MIYEEAKAQGLVRDSIGRLDIEELRRLTADTDAEYIARDAEYIARYPTTRRYARLKKQMHNAARAGEDSIKVCYMQDRERRALRMLGYTVSFGGLAPRSLGRDCDYVSWTPDPPSGGSDAKPAYPPRDRIRLR